MDIKDIKLEDVKDLNMDKGLLLVNYRKYKDFILPLTVIFVSVAILVFVLIPQANQYLSQRGQLDTENQKLTLLKNNYNFLSNLDQPTLDSQLGTLSKVLPPDKDFVGIVTAITTVSSKTGVSIGDFSFVVGNLSNNSNGSNSSPNIEVQLTLKGDPKSISTFLLELYKTAPVVEIKKVQVGAQGSTISVLFYYKPYPPQNVGDASPVIPLTASDNKLLGDFSSWNNITQQAQSLFPNLNLNQSTPGSINSSGSASSTSPQPGGTTSPF